MNWWRIAWFTRLGISTLLTVAMVVYWNDQSSLVKIVTVMSAYALFTLSLIHI